MAYSRRRASSTRRRSPVRRASRAYSGRRKRAPVRRVSSGRAARPQLLRIVIEQPGQTLARPDLGQEQTERPARRAKF